MASSKARFEAQVKLLILLDSLDVSGRNLTQILSSGVSAAENLDLKIKVLEFWKRTLYLQNKSVKALMYNSEFM